MDVRTIRDYRQMWQVFFFGFVNPEARTGPLLDYAERVREAGAFLLPGRWVMLRSAAPSR